MVATEYMTLLSTTIDDTALLSWLAFVGVDADVVVMEGDVVVVGYRLNQINFLECVHLYHSELTSGPLL